MAVGRFWTEVWDRPGAPNYGRKLAELGTETASFTKRHTGVGLGNCDLPKGSAELASILVVDPDTPANSVWSTIKIFNESSPTDPVFEWLPDPVLPAIRKTDAIDQVSGAGIESVVGFARVEPYDWDGSDDFASVDPNWSFGGGINMITNPSFESQPAPNGGFEDGTTGYWSTSDDSGVFNAPSAFTVVKDAAVAQAGDWYGSFNPTSAYSGVQRSFGNLTPGETYTITGYLREPAASGLTYRMGIQGASSASHTNAYNEDDFWWADLGNAAQDSSSSTNTWQLTTLTFVADADQILFVAVYSDAGNGPLTYIDSVTISGDGVGLDGWVPRGQVDIMDVSSAQARTGAQSMRVQVTDFEDVNGFFNNSGPQRAFTLTPGKTYTASAWIFHASGSTERFRLKIRRQGRIPGAGNFESAAVAQGVLTSTWTKLEVTFVADFADVLFQITWRDTPQANAQSPIFWVDDVALYEGLPATTVGDMFSLLYDHAIDVDLRNPIVWDDGSGTDTPYLTLDFDATNDSGSVAWDNDEVGLVFNPRMSYLQVLERIAALGYQWRVVPDSTVGYYLLQLYNPGGLGTAQGAIQTGSVDISNQSRFIRPFSDVVVQGQQNTSARDRNTDLLSAFGRIEASTLDLNISDLADGSVAAADALADSLTNAEALTITTVPQVGTPEPLIAYDVGDTLTVGRASGVSQRQLNELEVSWGASVEYTHKFGSVVVSGPGAIGSAVNYLLTRFKRADAPISTAVPFFGGEGGGAPTIVVAASDATELSKARADLICDGVNDHEVIFAAIEALGAIGGRVLLTEGTFNVEPSEITVDGLIHLQGLGMLKTIIRSTAVGTSADFVIEIVTDGELSNLGIATTVYTGTVVDSSYGRIDHVFLSGPANIGFNLDGIQHPVHSLLLTGHYADAGIVLDEGWATVHDVIIIDTTV